MGRTIDSKLSRLCDGLIEAGWLVAVIAIPLFFNIHSERVFEPDKIALLRSIALLMSAAWLVKFVDQRGWQQARALHWRGEDAFWRRPFVLPILALVLIYLLATLFSITPRVSFFGSYQRLQGTYTTFSYVVIFALLVATVRTQAQVRRVVTAVIITSIPIAFYGFLQHYELDPLPWGGDTTRRVAGHMGNAIFIAAYLIMVVPLTLGRVLDAFTSILSDVELSYADVLRASIYIFALFTQLLTIYWSGSRGPLIGLATGLFSFTLVLLVSLRNATPQQSRFRRREIGLALLLVLPTVFVLLLSSPLQRMLSRLLAFAIFGGVLALSVLAVFLMVALRRGWRWLWLSWILLTLFVAGWLLLFNVPEERLQAAGDAPVVGPVAQALVAWKELPTIGSYGRMLDPSQTEGREKSNRVRVLIWEGVVDLISPHAPLDYPDGGSDAFNFWRPLIGYGPEAMYVAYNRFYPPELATVEARNASPDRSHNETFDALVITGLLGFLAWQALYVTVFYYGFRYLGVVRGRRDRNILIGLWAGGALLGALLSLLLFDPIYLGVAVPTGTIVGLVVYLVYYAAFTEGASETTEEDGRPQPFRTRHLLMNALVAAVLAHYVEVHFGIAIAATRLHFFLFVGLMLLISYRLPQLETAAAGPARKGRAAVRANDDFVPAGVWGNFLLWTFLLALVVGIIGFSFVNYALPPDKVVETAADITTGDVFRQSLFVNPQEGFQPSPFIFLMMLIAWGLGSLLAVSEMVKEGVFAVAAAKATAVTASRRQAAAGAFVLLGLAGIAVVLVPLPSDVTSFGFRALLLLLWVGLCLYPALRLLRNGNASVLPATAVAALATVIALPLLVAGNGWLGLATAALGVAILALLWEDKSWRPFVVPPLLLGFLSLGIGLAYTYFQALLVRESLLYLLFYQGIGPVSTLYTLFFRPETTPESVVQLRVWEAEQATHFLTGFYWFAFGLLALAGLALAWQGMRRATRTATAVSGATAVVALLLGALLITQTNVRPVQADMVYKRGKPFDDQATRTGDVASWDTAVAIYERAVAMAPLEDFYYLFLGRAYLERATVAQDAEEQLALFDVAENRLLRAQAINPLNTDHTANLARLNSRWAVADAAVNPQARVVAAENYYQEALDLSPQNSVIRNEYARLAYDLKGDCAQAKEIFDRSVTIDPFYDVTYFARANVLLACAAGADEAATRQAYYEAAVASVDEGLAREPRDPRLWLEAAQLYQQLGRFEPALAALEQVRGTATQQIPPWNVAYLEATIYRDMGDLAAARAAAGEALAQAPPEVAPQIESFLQQLGGTSP